MLFRSNDTATTEIYTRTYTLSLHDALPISSNVTGVQTCALPICSPFGGHQGVFPELTLAAGAPVYRRRDDARRSGGMV